MLKLPEKLRIFKIKSRQTSQDIANSLGISLQGVSNWLSETRTPKKLKLIWAERLVKHTNGYITLKDCGHTEDGI